MSEKRTRRRSRDKMREARTGGLSQLPWQRVINPYPALNALSEDQIEAVHDASMRILEEQGIEVMSDRARQFYRSAGADVDDASEIVRMDRALVMELISKAPSEFNITPRNRDRAVRIGGNEIHFGMVSGPPNVHDMIKGRRPGNYEDLCNLVRLGQYFNIIHFFGNQTLAPIDLPANNRHLDSYMVNLTLSDKVFNAIPIGAGRTRDALEMSAIAAGIDVEDMIGDPRIITNISVNSPRRLDIEMSDAIITMAQVGQPVIITPFTLMGAMTPVTLAAASAQQNAEALLTLCLIQIVRPGAPMVYGAFTSNVALRSGAPAFGTPENSKANIIGGQLARYYNLPHRTSACSASNIADVQGAYESQMALWGASLTYGHIIYHAAGWQEGGLVASYEKFILDVEALQHMAEFMKPITINEEEFGLDAIEEVGPGGHFFGCQHTIDRYQTAFYEPIISDWQNFENWQIAGAKTATERATDVWQQALRDYEEPPLDPGIKDALNAYIAKRKEEIGDGDP